MADAPDMIAFRAQARGRIADLRRLADGDLPPRTAARAHTLSAMTQRAKTRPPTLAALKFGAKADAKKEL